MGKTTLRDVSRKMKINKSKLHYYISIGLIIPKQELSGMFIFDEDDLIDRIKKISSLKESGMSLSKIKKEL